MFKTYKPSEAMLAAMQARMAGNQEADTQEAGTHHANAEDSWQRSFEGRHSALARAGSSIFSSPRRKLAGHTSTNASLHRSMVSLRHDDVLRPVVEDSTSFVQPGVRGLPGIHRVVPAEQAGYKAAKVSPSTAGHIATPRSDDWNAKLSRAASVRSTKLSRAASVRSTKSYAAPLSVRSESTNTKVSHTASGRLKDKRVKNRDATGHSENTFATSSFVRSKNVNAWVSQAASRRVEEKRAKILGGAWRSENSNPKIPVTPTVRSRNTRVQPAVASASAPLVDAKVDVPVRAGDRHGLCPVAATVSPEDKIKLLTRALQAPYKFVAKPAPSFARCPSNYARKKVRLKEALSGNRQPSVTDEANKGDYVAEMEKQKLRVANKMETLNFYAACQSKMLNMTQQHNDALRRKLLHGDKNSENVAKSMSAIGLERELNSWKEKSENTTGVTQRLKRVDAFISAQSTSTLFL